MADKGRCAWNKCAAKVGPCHFIYGNGYCSEHYYPVLERKFLEEYNEWDGKKTPSRKFLNLFSRYGEAIYFCRGENIPGGLSKGRLENRTFDIKKMKIGLDFSIVRHYKAWTNPLKMEEVEEHWRFNIKRKMLRLLSKTFLETSEQKLSNSFL